MPSHGNACQYFIWGLRLCALRTSTKPTADTLLFMCIHLDTVGLMLDCNERTDSPWLFVLWPKNGGETRERSFVYRLPGSGRAKRIDCCHVLLGLRHRRRRCVEQGISRSRLWKMHGFPKTPGDKRGFLKHLVFCILHFMDESRKWQH